jgi:hypothetical protein
MEPSSSGPMASFIKRFQSRGRESGPAEPCKHAACSRTHPVNECCICRGPHFVHRCWHVVGMFWDFLMELLLLRTTLSSNIGQMKDLRIAIMHHQEHPAQWSASQSSRSFSRLCCSIRRRCSKDLLKHSAQLSFSDPVPCFPRKHAIDDTQHLKGHFFGVWSNSVVRGTEFLRFGLTIHHF